VPITPFHFGPGALLHAAAPKHVSFLAFCAANVVIDVESLYNLVHRNEPVHAFFHTCVGATLIVVVVCALFFAARWFAARFRLPDLFGWRALSGRQVVIGAALGAWSHVVLDSVMHADIRPLSPFSAGNGLLGAIPLGPLHLACLVAGGVGALLVGLRWWLGGGERGRTRV
jgi:membrane-bound metal-dependent hydrolase YbcI (DUF457 family)